MLCCWPTSLLSESLILTNQTYSSTAALNTDLSGKEGILKQGNETASITVNGVIGTNLIDIEAGTLAFSGSRGSTPSFNGTINVSSGAAILLNGHDTLGYTPSGNVTDKYTINLAGTMRLEGTNQSFGNFTLNFQGGTVSRTGSCYFAWLRNTTEVKASSGNSIFNAPINFGSLLTGTVKVDVAENASLDLQGTWSGSTNFSQFTKTGGGTLRISKPVHYNVLTQVEGGTLQLGGNNIFSSTSAGVALAAETFFDMNGKNQELKILQGSGTVTNSTATLSTLTMNLTEASTFSGSFGQSGNSALSIVQKGNQTWTLDGTGNWYIDTWTIESGSAAMTKSTGNSHHIYGTITIAEGAQLSLRVRDALGYEVPTTETAGKGYTLNIGGTLEISGANQTLTQAVWNFTGGNLVQASGQNTVVDYLRNYTQINVTRGDSRFGAPLRIGSAADTATLHIAENASLTMEKGVQRRDTGKSINIHKTGEGTLVFAGTEPYRLTETKISKGKLILEGSTLQTGLTDTSSMVFIEESAQFFASGGATIHGTLNLQGEYVLRLIDLDTTQTNLILDDLILGENATVTLDITDVLLSDYENVALLEGKTEDMDTIFRQFSTLFEENADAHNFHLSLNQNTIFLSTDRGAVPEPSAWMLLLAGLGGLFWCRKK
ncbi:MAG: PEP-CTERM sorting domain-containing protein [Planctomycetia bacterium]|nr:PEP-CTERM sorting domain-containing protein [Planctomycetia bacterium]